jgi:hypothetical protein
MRHEHLQLNTKKLVNFGKHTIVARHTIDFYQLLQVLHRTTMKKQPRYRTLLTYHLATKGYLILATGKRFHIRDVSKIHHLNRNKK